MPKVKVHYNYISQEVIIIKVEDNNKIFREEGKILRNINRKGKMFTLERKLSMNIRTLKVEEGEGGGGGVSKRGMRKLLLI